MKNPLYFSFAVLLMLFLNLSGLLVSKYLTLISRNKLSILLILIIVLMLIYFLRTIYWMVIAKFYQLSYLYPFQGLNYAGAFILGIVLFEEEFEIKKIIALCIISIGIFFLTKSVHKDQKVSEVHNE